ncbi:MAG: L,D-transpeptidase family protein, partial [Myxococcaceae bacterium]
TLMVALVLVLLAWPALADPFDDYLATPFPAADGFVVPRRATAAANGRVVAVGEGQVELEHVFFENHRRRLVRTRYAPLAEVLVQEGDQVGRGARLGEVARRAALRFQVFEGDQLLEAAAFVAAHRELLVPPAEPRLLLVDSAAHRLRYYEAGRAVADLEVAFGQETGAKRQRGDLRTPAGMYFVIEKRKGEFPGAYGDFFGGHWIKVNYPNAFDAKAGLAEGRVTAAQAEAIGDAWRKRAATDQRTVLGGGIGLHGWAAAWDGADGGYGLSWGCVVLHNEDIEALFDHVAIGTLVVLL